MNGRFWTGCIICINAFPHSFHPERFNKVSKGTEFRPFGIPSRRKCPADQFSYFMGGMYITELLRDFTIILSSDDKVNQVYGLTSAPKDEVCIQIQPRSKA